jgi:hypothetical protein
MNSILPSIPDNFNLLETFFAKIFAPYNVGVFSNWNAQGFGVFAVDAKAAAILVDHHTPNCSKEVEQNVFVTEAVKVNPILVDVVTKLAFAVCLKLFA